MIELEKFIGLSNVKKEIKSLVNFQQIQIERGKYGIERQKGRNDHQNPDNFWSRRSLLHQNHLLLL